ncbi:MAG: 4-hydroxy-tetrahydrodipicolinate synthase [Bacteroidales bacterium]|nr:4-hydroxy-tetrahydrodipicolinate synthase [Bacteroidales bacterium]
MHNINLSGCGTALVTPFKNGAVDFDAYRELVRRQIAGGIDFLVPLGTTAETPTLTADEKVELFKATREEAPGKILVAGVGSNSLQGTLANIELLTPYRPDAWLVVVPFYNKPSQEGIYQYYKAVSEATDIPVLMYNVPGRTGVNMEASTCIRLAKLPNIIGVKEASSRYGQISEIIRGTENEDFQVLSGNDGETLSLMATGAKGVISVASNVAPELMVALTDALTAFNITEARRLHHLLTPLFNACFVESNPTPTKLALEIMGYCSKDVRLPLVPASEKTKELMTDVIKEIGIC